MSSTEDLVLTAEAIDARRSASLAEILEQVIRRLREAGEPVSCPGLL